MFTIAYIVSPCRACAWTDVFERSGSRWRAQHRKLKERVFLAWHAGNGQATRRRRWGPRRRPGSWYHPAMKATLVAVLFLLAGCMAGGPPLKTGAPAAAE